MTIARGVLQLGVVPRAQPRREADPDMVAMLESLLQDAKDGQIVSLAYAAVYADDDTIRTAYAFPEGNAFTLLGAIERAKLRFYKNHCTTDEE